MKSVPYFLLLLFSCTVSSDDNFNCGRRQGFVGTILGGEKVRKGEWPWTVAVYHLQVEKSSPRERFSCSGSLISQQHILSGKNSYKEAISDSTFFLQLLTVSNLKQWLKKYLKVL